MSLFFDGALSRYVLIDNSKMTDKDARIDRMMLDICNELEEWKPDIVYQEDTWLGRNAETDQMLCSLVGAVRYWCASRGCEYHKIKPVTWRATVGLDPKAKREDAKRESVEFVLEKYTAAVGDDVADAICVGLAGVMYKE